jgi:hypothetical protein
MLYTNMTKISQKIQTEFLIKILMCCTENMTHIFAENSNGIFDYKFNVLYRNMTHIFAENSNGKFNHYISLVSRIFI